MLRASIMNRSLVDDIFDNMFSFPEKSYKNTPVSIMKTDVKNFEDHYELDMDLPGYKKEDLQIELKEGFLTITASKNEEVNEEKEEGKYVRRERHYGSCQRRFYVGEGMKQEDIKATFNDGVLQLVFPKVEKKPDENKYITIQ